MDGDLWQRVSALFDKALERPAGQRQGFLESACQGDPELLAEVSRLLSAYETAGDFLEASPFQGPSPGLLTGKRLSDRYLVGKLLGYGGMGEVYEAYDEYLDESIALKTLKPDLVGAAFLQRFRHEVQLARKVSHPCVCRIFDMGVHEAEGARPVHYLTMQLLDGETLAAKVKREGPLPPEAALAIAAQVASGLDAAHAAGVTHGDLKSANVMCTGDRAVITDFGLARLSSAEMDGAVVSGSVASVVQLLGTVASMSPEQLEGRPPTLASDVYAFGVLLFEMIVGRSPFDDPHVIRSAMQRVTAEAPDIRSMAPDMDPLWAEVIARCLRRDPAQRYARASEAVRRLQSRHLLALPRWSRRRWLAVSGAAGGLALIVAASRFYPRDPELPEGAEIVLGAIENLTGNESFGAATELFRNQLGQSARVSLVDEQRVLSALRQMGLPNADVVDPNALREAAWRVNAAVTVFGTIASVGPDLVLTVQVETRGSQPDRPRTRLLRSFSARDPRALMASVREASLWVREVAGEAAPAIASADLLPEDATTPSWRALAHYAKGQQLFLAQQFNPALDKFAEALAEDPQFTLAALRRADLLVSQNRQAEGFATYRTAMRLLEERRVTRPEELYGRGMYALDSGDYEAADRHFRTWQAEYPHDWRAPFYRTMPLCLNGHPEQAVELLRPLRSVVPEYGDLYVQTLRALLMTGRTGDARELLPVIRRLNRPERADLNEAYILFREADCVGGLQILREVQKSTYRRGATDAMLQEGLLLIDAGHPEAAAENIGAFLRRGSWVDAGPQQIALQIVQAWAQMMAGRRSAAVETAKLAVAREAAPVIIALAGTIFARCRRPDLAEAMKASTVPWLDIRHYRIANHRIAGEQLRQAGNEEAGLAEIRRAAELEPAVAHRQYLMEALPEGSDERLTLARRALQYPWQNWRPPLIHHIGAVGMAVRTMVSAGVPDEFARRFAESGRQLESRL